MSNNKQSRYNLIAYNRLSDDFSNTLVRTEITTEYRPTSYAALKKRIYTAYEGDTYRSLALTYLGSEEYWWLIADINYRIPLYLGAFGLPAGAIIEIPDR